MSLWSLLKARRLALRRGFATLTLRQRVNAAILATFFLIALVFSAVLVPRHQHSLQSAVRKAKVLIETVIARDREALANEIFEKQVRASRQRLIEMHKAEGILAIGVFDASGQLLVSEGGLTRASTLGPDDLFVPNRLQMRQIEWQRHSALRFFEPIELVGERIGFIEIIYSLEDIERDQRISLLTMASLLGSVLLAMMGLLNFILARTITRPITSLSKAIELVQGGALGTQVEVERQDEIGTLSKAFNRMSVDLKRAIDNLADANAVLERRIEQRTAHLNESLAQLRATQSQMIQQEKMASLGQLVASVAHEINTPIAAVKSSGRNAAEALAQTLRELPALYQNLDPDDVARFDALLAHAREGGTLRTTREERALVADMAAELDRERVGDARRVAALLVQCQLTRFDPYLLPLLRHPRHAQILEAAHSVAAAVSNTANINTAVDRVAKIVFALKAFSRVDHSGAMVAASLEEGIETVLTIYQNQIKHHIELVRRFEPVAPVMCLPDELNQVWTNLVHNALQAMNYRGTLTVGVRADGDDVVVSVGDTGCGIPAALRERIFEPFFTTKPSGEGSGLGLDIVRRIVEKHGGRIVVDSQEGVGTRFEVHLPRKQA